MTPRKGSESGVSAIENIYTEISFSLKGGIDPIFILHSLLIWNDFLEFVI